MKKFNSMILVLCMLAGAIPAGLAEEYFVEEADIDAGEDGFSSEIFFTEETPDSAESSVFEPVAAGQEEDLLATEMEAILFGSDEKSTSETAAGETAETETASDLEQVLAAAAAGSDAEITAEETAETEAASDMEQAPAAAGSDAETAAEETAETEAASDMEQAPAAAGSVAETAAEETAETEAAAAETEAKDTAEEEKAESELFAFQEPAATAEELTAGTMECGLTWKLDDDGLLSVDGQGNMTWDAVSMTSPWNACKDKILSVRIGQGVTSIAPEAFSDCANLKTVILADSVTEIGDNAFGNVTATVDCLNDNAAWTESFCQNYGGILTWNVAKASAVVARGDETADAESKAVVANAAYTYTITYVLNGGTNSTSNPAGYNYNKKADVALKNASRKGYTFAGWYSDKALKKQIKTITKGSKGNKTVYAKWTANKYTIKYYQNKPSGAPKDVTGTVKTTSAVYNQSATISKTTYSCTGYKFVSWNTAANGTGTQYSAGASVKNLTDQSNGVIKLYAQWRPVNYTITYYNLNGGTFGADAAGKTVSNPASYTVVSSDITLANPSRKTYTFAGWYSDSKFKTQIKKIAKGSTGNMKVYAKWTANKYTIAYAKNAPSGASIGGSMGSTTASYDSKVSLSAVGFTSEVYAFEGWNTKADGSGISYADGASVKNLTDVKNGTVTIYAQWKLYSTKVEEFRNKSGYSSLKVSQQAYLLGNTSSNVDKQKQLKTDKGKYCYRLDSGKVENSSSVKKGSLYAAYIADGICDVNSTTTLLNRASLYYCNNSSNPFTDLNVLPSGTSSWWFSKVSDSKTGRIVKDGTTKSVVIAQYLGKSSTKNATRPGYVKPSGTSTVTVGTFTSGNAHIQISAYKKGKTKTLADIRKLLRNHPEGVLVHYFYSNGSGQHTIVITRYVINANGTYTYYCCDPVYWSKGEIKLNSAWKISTFKSDLSNLTFDFVHYVSKGY